jgi:hypothetical protein
MSNDFYGFLIDELGISLTEIPNYLNNKNFYQKYYKKFLLKYGSKKYDYLFYDNSKLADNEEITNFKNLQEFYKKWFNFLYKITQTSYEVEELRLRTDPNVDNLKLIKNLNKFIKEKILNKNEYYKNNIMKEINDEFSLIKNGNLIKYHLISVYNYLDIKISLDKKIFLDYIKQKNPFFTKIVKIYFKNDGFKYEIDNVINKIEYKAIKLKNDDKFYIIVLTPDFLKKIRIKNFHDDIENNSQFMDNQRFQNEIIDKIRYNCKQKIDSNLKIANKYPN